MWWFHLTTTVNGILGTELRLRIVNQLLPRDKSQLPFWLTKVDRKEGMITHLTVRPTITVMVDITSMVMEITAVDTTTGSTHHPNSLVITCQKWKARLIMDLPVSPMRISVPGVGHVIIAA
jgi:hypothetical protein